MNLVDNSFFSPPFHRVVNYNRLYGVVSFIRFAKQLTQTSHQPRPATEISFRESPTTRQSLITTLTTTSKPRRRRRSTSGAPADGASARWRAAKKVAKRFAAFDVSIHNLWIMSLSTITFAINRWNLLMLLTVTSSDVQLGIGASGAR